MMSLNRYILDTENRASLCLQSLSDPNTTQVFEAHECLGAGGSSVWYRGRLNGVPGRLKEFYPIPTGAAETDFGLRRTQDNQLISSDQTFARLCSERIEVYDMIAAVKKQDARNAVLHNFIPPFQLFRGICSGKGEATLYAWSTDETAGKSFGDDLREIRQTPQIEPEHKLFHILSTMLTLTDCICGLHMAGVLHLDIKPDNFLLAYDSSMNANPGNISLFDIDSAVSAFSQTLRSRGTVGFRAPELLRGSFDNRSDIYSLGAVLYYGIIISDELSPLYWDENYPILPELLENSDLIRACNSNTAPNLKYILLEILKKSLHPNPEQRYACCEEMIADLKEARAYLLTDVFQRDLPMRRRLSAIGTPQTHSLSEEYVLKCLLSEHPLYEALQPDEEALRILVIGEGAAAQNFIDCALSLGQLTKAEPRIDVFSHNRDLERETYLNFRPALGDYFRIDERECRFGDYRFGAVRFDAYDADMGKGISKCVLKALRAEKYHYIFVDLQDDAHNQRVAAQCRAYASEACPIAFVCRSACEKYAQMIPVFLNNAKQPDAQLEQRAFNVHLCWSDAKNLNIEAAYRQFRKPYYYEASVSYAMAIPYFLHCLGLAENGDLQKSLRQMLTSETACELAVMEHRHWLSEKVTQGWRLPQTESGTIDFDSFFRKGCLVDKKKKLHPALLPCTAALPLSDPDFSWEKESSADRLLDPLDRLSVALHRYMSANARILRAAQPLQEGSFLRLQELCRGGSPALAECFRRYTTCMEQIYDGSRTAAAYMEQAEKSLLARFRKESTEYPQAKQYLEEIRRVCFCITEGNSYRDYKAKNLELIRNLPFILSYRRNQPLALALGAKGAKDEMLRNIASATFLNAEKVFYLYVFEENTDTEVALKQLRHTAQYLIGRNSRCAVSLLGAVIAESADMRGLKKALSQMHAEGLLHSAELMSCENRDRAAEWFCRSLEEKGVTLYDESNALFSDESKFADMMRNGFSCFRCEPDALCQPDENYPENLSSKCHLLAEEIFALAGQPVPARFYPEYDREYDLLWRMTFGAGTQRSEAWLRLGDAVRQYVQKAEILAELLPEKSDRLQELCFYFPTFGVETVAALLDELVSVGLVDENYSLSYSAPDTCRLVLQTKWSLREMFDKLFSQPYCLTRMADLKALVTFEEGRAHLTLRHELLRVAELPVSEEATVALLQELSQHGFLHALQQAGSAVSFTFCGGWIKALLCAPTKLMEIYAFYRCIESGFFDSVECFDPKTSAIGAVVTKGMCSCAIAFAASKEELTAAQQALCALQDAAKLGMKCVVVGQKSREIPSIGCEALPEIAGMIRAIMG